MATVPNKVLQRLKKHTGTTDPDKIIQHFNQDEAIESSNPDMSESMKLMSGKSGMDMSGLKAFQKGYADENSALLAKGDDPDAILTRDEMNRLEELNAGDKYMDRPFDGSDGKPKSITRKVKAVTVKEGKKPPITVAKKEEVVPYLNAGPGFTGKKVPASSDAYKRLQMSQMDSGRAEDSGRGLGMIGESVLDATALRGLGGLIGGVRSITSGLGKRGMTEMAKDSEGPLADIIGGASKDAGPSVGNITGKTPEATVNAIKAAITKLKSQYGKSAKGKDSETLKSLHQQLKRLTSKLEE